MAGATPFLWFIAAGSLCFIDKNPSSKQNGMHVTKFIPGYAEMVIIDKGSNLNPLARRQKMNDNWFNKLVVGGQVGL